MWLLGQELNHIKGDFTKSMDSTIDYRLLIIDYTHGAAVRASDYCPCGHGFDSRLGRNQVTEVNSAFHPSGVGKPSTSLQWLGLRRGAFARVGWQVTLRDPARQATPSSSEMGIRNLTLL